MAAALFALALIVVAGTSTANAQEPAPLTFGPWNGGIQALTEQGRLDAIECGKQYHSGCGSDTGSICGFSTIHVLVQTPFSRVMLTTQSDLVDLRTSKPMTLAAANLAGTVIIVTPVSDFTKIQSVRRAVIERDGVRIQPTSAALLPQTYTNGFGASKTANDGEFRFPRAALAPGAVVRLLLAFDGDGPLTCEITEAQRRSLR